MNFRSLSDSSRDRLNPNGENLLEEETSRFDIPTFSPRSRQAANSQEPINNLNSGLSSTDTGRGSNDSDSGLTPMTEDGASSLISPASLSSLEQRGEASQRPFQLAKAFAGQQQRSGQQPARQQQSGQAGPGGQPDFDGQKPTVGTTELPELLVDSETQLVTVDDSSPSISVQWDQAVQQAVINDSPGPTVASRAYSILHTAMFDAWAAYDAEAIATQLGDDLQQEASESTVANKTEAMSYAGYRVLTELFPEQTGIFDELMVELGFDTSNTTTDTTTAAGIGNVSAEALMEFRRNDGSNQLGDEANGTLGVAYSDYTDYQPVNNISETSEIEYWTPETVPIDAELSEGAAYQSFLTPQWGEVETFGLASGDELRPEAPEPFLVEGVEATVDLEAKTITLADGTALAISQDLIGTVINPEFIAQAERVIEASANLTDEEKLIAEFWEDGGGTSFPPGTWMTFGQFVSARDDNSLDTDAQMFFALSNAVSDAGIATWEAKTYYDYARPVTTIRELGELGLVGEYNESLGGYAIEAWGGPGEGTETILATDFLTYQPPGSDPSPPFAEYTSGHSSFSASGAEILKLFTGSDSFGGSVSFDAGESRFEPGVTPNDTVTLAWDSFTEAADEAGLSRIYGGIHFDDGDLNGRILGSEVGSAVLDQALFYINGGQEINSIVGSEEQESLTGTAGSDRIVALSGNDQVNGGEGDDQLLGGEDNDQLFGGQGEDKLEGGNGFDSLDGGSENDILLGGSGNDRLVGGSGNDLLLGGADNDVLTGGEGQDGFVFSSGDGTDTILDFAAGTDFITLLSDSLTYESLELTQQGSSTVLGIAATGETLGIFQGIQAPTLTDEQFVFASDISEVIASQSASSFV